jgi:hypothetical protein
MRIGRALTAAGVVVGLAVAAGAAPPTAYLRYAPPGPARLEEGDPTAVAAARWQVWLYPAGLDVGATPDAARWGILEAAAAADVLRQLVRRQQLERQGRPPDLAAPPGAATYFNAVGPVAREDPLPTAAQQLATAATQTEALAGALAARHAAAAPAGDPADAEALGQAWHAVAAAREALERPATVGAARRALLDAVQHLAAAEERWAARPRGAPVLPDPAAAPALWDLTFPPLGATPAYRVQYGWTQDAPDRWRLQNRTSDLTGALEYAALELGFDLHRLRGLRLQPLDPASRLGADDPRMLLVLQFDEGTVQYLRREAAGQPQTGTVSVIQLLYPTRALAERAQAFFEQTVRALTPPSAATLQRIQALRELLQTAAAPAPAPPPPGSPAPPALAAPPAPPTAPDGSDFDALFDLYLRNQRPGEKLF